MKNTYVEESVRKIVESNHDTEIRALAAVWINAEGQVVVTFGHGEGLGFQLLGALHLLERTLEKKVLP